MLIKVSRQPILTPFDPSHIWLLIGNKKYEMKSNDGNFKYSEFE